MNLFMIKLLYSERSYRFSPKLNPCAARENSCKLLNSRSASTTYMTLHNSLHHYCEMQRSRKAKRFAQAPEVVKRRGNVKASQTLALRLGTYGTEKVKILRHWHLRKRPKSSNAPRSFRLCKNMHKHAVSWYLITKRHKWRFPKIGIPPNHPFLDGIFP